MIKSFFIIEPKKRLSLSYFKKYSNNFSYLDKS